MKVALVLGIAGVWVLVFLIGIAKGWDAEYTKEKLK